MGVDKKALAVYIKRGFPQATEPFPEPVQRLASGPVWRKSDIERFKSAMIRLYGEKEDK